MISAMSAASSTSPSAARPSSPQENAKPPAGNALSPNCSISSRVAASSVNDFLHQAGGEHRTQPSAIVLKRTVQQNRQNIVIEAHAPMQVASVPSELHGGGGIG